MSENATPEPIGISPDKAREALLALTEMRGFMTYAPRRERDFMLPRIDKCVEVFGIADIVRRIHHDVMEGVRGDD